MDSPTPTPITSFSSIHSPPAHLLCRSQKDSITRYQRDGWVYHANGNGNGDSDSNGNAICLSSSQLSSETEPDRDREIELQLPELRKLLELIRSDKRKIDKVASVALVGTGPGDPELLTVKAVRAIEKADLVLYDRLVSNEVLDLVGPSARLLYVGKTAGFHSRTQEEIHELLILSFAEACRYLAVVGKKWISSSGISAELEIPLTHRGIANSVRFLTGHSRNGGTDPLFISEHAADCDSTLVVYMGLSTLPSLTPNLISHGLSPETPSVAIERGTTPQQRVIFAELKNLVDDVKSAALV
ncbi:Sirohydrochlorin ferrochelatase [Zostera marina]|uniref:uroporphyrinogen-III C-methyltransferase n=1 Tax=Zostera marina TaxID=29655 RepID=A0A0K9PPR5_ZOSMR|nr:Sirohydrochlorin ferrochelatase [Zostera marina]